MLRLHANVYAMPSPVVAGPVRTLDRLDLPTLQGERGGPPLFLRTMPVTFEAMQQRLLELPRCDCEPDGFFLLTGREGGYFWKLNGHLHEYKESLHRVELNGECPEASLDAVLGAMGWPGEELAFELVREGVTLDEASLRAWARRQCE